MCQYIILIKFTAIPLFLNVQEYILQRHTYCLLDKVCQVVVLDHVRSICISLFINFILLYGGHC